MLKEMRLVIGGICVRGQRDAKRKMRFGKRQEIMDRDCKIMGNIIDC